MLDFLQYQFMQNAFYAAFLASIACGIVGTLVVVKRIVFISGGIAHAAFGGIGLGYLLGINPIFAITPFSLAAAIIIGLISKKTNISEDSAIGIIWSVGMALGILFIGLVPGYSPDLFSYLFGNILTVPNFDLVLMLVLDILILTTTTIFYRAFLIICFDEEYARSRGINVTFYYLLLLSLIAFTIVILIRIVGIILVISLLTIPALVSKLFTQNFKIMMVFSVFTGMFFTIFGILLSYYFNLPSGATIILFSVFIYLVSLFFSKVRFKSK